MKENIIDKLDGRLARLEGQVKGVRRMLESGKPCVNIVTQLLAIREAAGSIGVSLLEDHFCATKDKGKIDEKYLKALFKVR